MFTLLATLLLSSCAINNRNNNLDVPYRVTSIATYNKELKKSLVGSQLSDNTLLSLKETSGIVGYCIEDVLVVTGGVLNSEDTKSVENKGVKIVYTKNIKELVDVTTFNLEEVVKAVKENEFVICDKIVIPCTDKVLTKLENKDFNAKTILSLFNKAGVMKNPSWNS